MAHLRNWINKQLNKTDNSPLRRLFLTGLKGQM